MGIIEISDIEDATGQVVDDAAKAQFLIDAISAFIENYTGYVFGRTVTETVRRKADPYGVIEFTDLDAVTDVIDYATQTPAMSWGYDGMTTVYGLCSNQVVDMTITYGWLDTPDDISSICVALVADALGLPLLSATDLQKKRVGDVEYTYSTSVSPDGSVDVNVSGLMSSALDSYRRKNFTIRTGPLRFSPLGSSPFWWNWY